MRFGGKATKGSDDGKITLSPFRGEDWHDSRGDAINNSSRVSWKATVKPEEYFEPKVEHEFFVRY